MAGIYRSLLSLGPAFKVLHGSDANSVPEEIGYCAANSRAALALVLNEYRETFGWTAQDVAMTARAVLVGNAREFYRL